MNIINRIGDFFLDLFSPEKERRKKRELRQIRQTIKEFKPNVYKPVSKMVQPAFANALYNFTLLIKPLQDVFENSLLASDSRIARRHWDWLLESRLSDKVFRLVEGLYYENLLQRFSLEPDRKALTARVRAEGSTVLKALDGPEMRMADGDLMELERIVDICRYDYIRILRHFTPKDGGKTREGRVKYQAANAEPLAAELADLYSVFAGARMTAAVQEDVLRLASRQGSQAISAMEKRLTKLANQMNHFLDSIFSEKLLVPLVQLIKEDSSYMPPPPVQPAARLSVYRETLVRRFKDDIDRIQRELQETALSADIAKLFGSSPKGGLLSAISYNDDLNSRLQTEAALSLRYVMPFRLLKTFDRRFITREYIEACKRVVVEGFFNNTLFRSRMTDTIGKIEKTQTRISIFEEASATKGRVNTASLRRALDEMGKGKLKVESVERIATSLDQGARELVEQEVLTLRELAEFVHDVISDFKKPTPDLVVNIKTLANSKEKQLIPTMLNGYNATAQFLKIMKAFMIVSPIKDEHSV